MPGCRPPRCISRHQNSAGELPAGDGQHGGEPVHSGGPDRGRPGEPAAAVDAGADPPEGGGLREGGPGLRPRGEPAARGRERPEPAGVLPGQARPPGRGRGGLRPRAGSGRPQQARALQPRRLSAADGQVRHGHRGLLALPRTRPRRPRAAVQPGHMSPGTRQQGQGSQRLQPRLPTSLPRPP